MREKENEIGGTLSCRGGQTEHKLRFGSNVAARSPSLEAERDTFWVR